MFFLKKILEKASPDELRVLYTTAKGILFHHLSREEQSRLHWENENKGRSPHTSPWALSQEDILLYKTYITSFFQGTQNSSLRVLILGVTPSLRLLLHDIGVFYIVVDQSVTMFEKTKWHLPKYATEKEIWVRAPWNSLPFPVDYFDCIIGDLVLFQFLPEEQEKFLSVVRSFLKPHGIFVGRVHFTSNSALQKKPAHIIESVLSNEIDEIAASNRLMAALLDVCGDIYIGRTNRIKALEEIKTYSPKTARDRRILQKILEDWGRSFFDYALQERSSIEALFNKNFSSVVFASSHDYPESDFYPIVCARK